MPDLVHTDQATSAILAMCSTHGMAGCSNCTSAAKCPDPLGTFSQLCLGMAGMAQCAPFFAMCEGEGVASTFGSLCSSSGSDSLPPMKMYLHASMSGGWVPALQRFRRGEAWALGGGPGYGTACRGGLQPAWTSACPHGRPALVCTSGARNVDTQICAPCLPAHPPACLPAEIILLKSWVPQNAGTYVASCLAIIATAVLVQAIKGFRLVLEGDWAAQRAAAAKSAGACGAGPGAAAAANGGGLPTLDPGSRGSDSGSALGAPLLRQRRSTLLPLAGGGQARRNAIRACFTLLVGGVRVGGQAGAGVGGCHAAGPGGFLLQLLQLASAAPAAKSCVAPRACCHVGHAAPTPPPPPKQEPFFRCPPRAHWATRQVVFLNPRP